MACVAVLSLMRTLELDFLQPHPRPILQQNEIIPCNKQLVQSLREKLGLVMEQFDEKRIDGVEAIKKLETKLRDVASRTEYEIELQVVHLYGEEVQGEEEEEEEEEEFRLFHLEMRHCHQILHPVTGKSHPCLKFRCILYRAKQNIDAIKEELLKVKMEYNNFIALETSLRDVEVEIVHVSKEEVEEEEIVHVSEEEVEEEDKPQGNTTPDPGRGCSMLCQIFHRPKGKPKRDNDEVGSSQHASHSKEIGSSQHASHSKEIIVGKHDEFEIIKKMLIEHPSKQLQVVSIKGMGGIGKTTLAKRVYEDPLIVEYFDKKAWVVVSQHHNKQQMLKGLLDSIGKVASGSDDDLATLLYQGLKGLRYLIVMDDIWSGEAWDAIKTCFPDDVMGSRVLLTTRLAEVANHTSSNNDFSHQVNLLDQTESWNLFYEKACKSHGAEFESIGRPVVEKCKGLPLAIVVVAGLFSKLKTLYEWENTANALSSSTATFDDEECSRILSLSYNHLPYNLKACFLYLGVFPEDHEIKANDLARLWFAEGLVKEFENESFDVVANRYIQELMDRNLIILSKLNSCGRKIKKFRMHDVLHAFCVREAQNENLLLVVMSKNSFDFPQNVFRWVSIQSRKFNLSTICSRLKSCRSFFSFMQDELSFNFKIFNLRVVYFDYYLDDTDGCVKNLVDIVHLRFVKLPDNNIELSRAGVFLKSSPGKNIKLSWAWNLQTLHCCGVSYDGVKYLEFPQLQYIRCTESCHGNPPNFVCNLRWLRADCCSKEYFMNIPYLKKVHIDGNSIDCNDCITNLVYLEQLERLCIMGDRTPTPINSHILLLENLRKLSLLKTGFEWKEINVVSKLPRLEMLKLMLSCEGKEWEIPEDEEEVIFSKLICLFVFDTDLEHWEASSDNFPNLEHLQLFYCDKLREIPISFVDIPTLKSIKLQFCLPSAVMSAKQIQEGQHDYGNENMIVIEENTVESSEHECDEHESD